MYIADLIQIAGRFIKNC